MVSDTIRSYIAKGVRYRHEFDHSTLSLSTIENIALKAALLQIGDWFQRLDKRNPIVGEIKVLLHDLWSVSNWRGRQSDLVSQLARRIRTLSPKLHHYRDPLWVSLLLLQNALPEVSVDGFVTLDSLIVDVSIVFESFVRRQLAERLPIRGFTVEDGNLRPGPFFQDSDAFTIHPDIIIRKDGVTVAILDVKYKPDPKEHDRYEVLSFMDAIGVNIGGFICPAVITDTSRYLGTTVSGKRMWSLRYDLSASDPDRESDQLAENVVRMLNGNRDFL